MVLCIAVYRGAVEEQEGGGCTKEINLCCLRLSNCILVKKNYLYPHQRTFFIAVRERERERDRERELNLRKRVIASPKVHQLNRKPGYVL